MQQRADSGADLRDWTVRRVWGWRRNSVSARPEGNTKTTKSPFVAEGDAGVHPELLSMKAQERV